jgi:anti-anti-sigma regulatory factor
MQRLGQCRRKVNAEATVRAIFMEDDAIRIATDVGFQEMTPRLSGVAFGSSTGTANEPEVCAEALLPELVDGVRYELPESTQKRMDIILRWLAALVGGESVTPLDVTSTDCIGWLERMLGEAALNVRFTVEALAERMEIIEEARQREALVEAQRSLIHELSAPIMPLLDRVLALPLVGPFDDIRAARVTEVLLERIAGSDTEVVLIDVTGVRAIDANGIEQWLRMTRAASLLGAECVIVGVTAAVAKEILVHAPDAALPRTFADLQSGVAYALTRTGRRIQRIADR